MQVGSAQGVKYNTQDPVKVKSNDKPSENASTSTIKSDSLSIKPMKTGGVSIKNITMNTLKGSGVGVLAGGVGGAGATALMIAPVLMKDGEGASYAILGVGAMAVGGAVVGGATGAIVANVTKNKVAGAVMGAVAGGAFAGLTRGDMTSAVIGAASGGLAGYFAAKVAK